LLSANAGGEDNPSRLLLPCGVKARGKDVMPVLLPEVLQLASLTSGGQKDRGEKILAPIQTCLLSVEPKVTQLDVEMSGSSTAHAINRSALFSEQQVRIEFLKFDYLRSSSDSIHSQDCR